MPLLNIMAASILETRLIVAAQFNQVNLVNKDKVEMV